MTLLLLNHRFWFPALVLILCFYSVAVSATRSNETDRLALLEFKAKITNEPLGIMSTWNTSQHFCNWHGVSCGGRHNQRVTKLNLSSLLLQGSISAHVGNLSFLQELRLYNNRLSNQIPPQIGLLRRLRMLLLDDNLLTGQIPANLSACSNLISLNLGYNRLVGKIPDLGSLSKLRLINFEHNNLTGGIPQFFGNLSNLELIYTTLNNFGGTIPDSLGQLTKLYFLSMGANMLSGAIPPSIYNISSMSVICLPQNQLRGTVPSDLGNIFPNLVEFNVGDNQFTGSIPTSLSNASNLERLTIALNGFTGKVPSLEKLHKLWWLSISANHLGNGEASDLDFLSTVTNATSLQLLAIHNNSFGGILPNAITNFSSLQILTLNDNQIFGNIPTGLGNLINLGMLHMGDNQLTGEIPEEIGKLQQLNELSLHRNTFSGKIPSSFGNLTLLTQLSMEGSNLTGNIPPELGKCQKLLSLNLNKNNLSGPIPKEVMSIPSLTIYLGFSQNQLTGSLPTEVGTLTNLGTLDVSGNMLSGEIPSSLGSCQSLEFLRMQDNFFQGVIPKSLSKLRGLQVFDISRNNLTGKIPLFFQGFRLLLRLNLSFNDFDGMVPKDGVFKNSTATSVAGNSKLCGGTAAFHLPACSINETDENGRLNLTMKLIIAASALICVALILLSLFLLLVKRKRSSSASNSKVNCDFPVSYQALHKATDGFSSINLLGAGSFGSVYKGINEKDGMVIAVKVLNLLHPGASKSFKAECEALKNIRHRNLVKLLTVCSGFDLNGNDFKALVYEFMANGNLEDWLHPGSLTFLQRFDIAVDVASALEYLRHGSHTPIVHCDLKPSNVLLNQELVGHVGDFGLARFFPETIGDSNPTHRSSTIGVRGSVGYTAPEYGMGNEVSTAGDVYSYGVLLLEMFTGKRPTDELFKDGLNLHAYVKAALPQKVEGILDPILVQEMKRKGGVEECMVTLLEIGVACSAELPGERMNISDVAAKMQAIRQKLVKNQEMKSDKLED